MKITINEANYLIEQINGILESADEIKKKFHSEIEKVHPVLKKSVDNLLDYIALRNVNVGDLQEQLSEIGLS